MKPKGFNPHARWDRHIPQGGAPQDSGLVNERIEVLALFRQAKIYPRLFIWRDKIYRIRRLNYNWQERRGRELINFFSVDTGSDLYQISFNNETSGWRIDKII